MYIDIRARYNIINFVIVVIIIINTTRVIYSRRNPMKCSTNIASHHEKREYIYTRTCVRTADDAMMRRECQTCMRFTTELIVCLDVSERRRARCYDDNCFYVMRVECHHTFHIILNVKIDIHT